MIVGVLIGNIKLSNIINIITVFTADTFLTMTSKTFTLILIITFLILDVTWALNFLQSSNTYARFPKWNACKNASISFEFRTRLPSALLMYTDDNGVNDFLEIMIMNGSVRLRMNFIDGKDNPVEMMVGQRMGDLNWHRVEVRRNRMETLFYVDHFHDSRVAFGSDFNFGDVSTNNYVFFGGLPQTYGNLSRLSKLSLTSAFYETRFVGEVRNVIYENCTCQPQRVRMIEGISYSREPQEACDVTNNCGACLCISGDERHGCQCQGFSCEHDHDTYYRLPMDKITGTSVDNPSGLDAQVLGSPQLVRGPVNNALKIDCDLEAVKVTGPGHRQECFGDLSMCPKGYTLSMWLKIDRLGSGQSVFLSNGGERQDSHGVAMMYEHGRMEWVFRMKTGNEWRVTAYNVFAQKWYHVTATWRQDKGLTLYINGRKAAYESMYTVRSSKRTPSVDDFIICQSNNVSRSRAVGAITVDEFQFWATELSEKQLRENGPIYSFHIPMDNLTEGHLVTTDFEPNTRGRLRQVPGMIGNAIQIPGAGEYIEFVDFKDTCLGNTTVCMYGFTVVFWIKFAKMENNAYVMASGTAGFSIFTLEKRLYVTVQSGDRLWNASVANLQTSSWYFLEITWNPTSGLEVYVNQKMAVKQDASSPRVAYSSKYNNFYIGRANTVMYNERYAAATVDDLHLYNGDRQRLLGLDYIARGKPKNEFYGFEAIASGVIENKNRLEPIRTSDGVVLIPGKIGKAVRINGLRQTIDFRAADGCLSDLDLCHHGMLLSLWINLEKMEDKMVYISSAINGIEISVANRKLMVTAETSTQLWKLITSSVTPDTWYYLEVTWSLEDGLTLYLDGKMIARDVNADEKTSTPDSTQPRSNKFLLGIDNAGRNKSVYGAAIFDEMELWEGSRDYLMSFGYIQRGKPDHFVISMDSIVDGGRRLEQASLRIMLYGYPLLENGVVKSALKLDGNQQYVDIGTNNDVCLGNLGHCKFGISIFFWLNIERYNYNMYILSTGKDGVQIFSNQGLIYFTINHMQHSWRLGIPNVSEKEWHFFELSWHPDFGMDLFIDYDQQYHADSRVIPETSRSDDSHFYVGRPNPTDVRGQSYSYGNMAIDELEVWYARRSYLIAFNHLLRDHVGYESFSMETALNDTVYHPRYRVTLERGSSLVPGPVGNAVSLRGQGDYVDLGNHMDKCFANIDLCNHGLTISMLLKPESLKSDQYFLAGPTYSLYLKKGKLIAEFHSEGKVWNVTSDKLNVNTWNNIVLSWERDSGLEIYLDGKLISRNSAPFDVNMNDASGTGNVYIGKSSDSTVAGTAEMMADEVQFWHASLDALKLRGLYQGPVQEIIQFSKMPPSGVLSQTGRRISLKGGATLVQGLKAQAVRLNGTRQFIDMGENLTCNGDLDNCRHGFTLRFATKPERLTNNMYFLDSYPLSVFYRDGRLYATVRAGRKSWTVAAPGFKAGEWQTVDVSWHPEIGLTLLANQREVAAHKTHGTDIDPVYDYDRNTLFGRAMSDMKTDRYADTTVEFIEVWNIRRDVLMSKNTINIGLPGITSGLDGTVTSQPVFGTLAPPFSSDDSRSVFITTAPQTGNGQQFNAGTRLTSVTSTSKIIRFYGKSYVQYDFSQLMDEILTPADNETFSMEFITQTADGLIWIWKGTGGRKMHFSLKSGTLFFVIDDGRGNPQQVRIQHPDSRVLGDFKWHKIRVDKNGRQLKFYIDEQLATQVTAYTDVQFLTSGATLYLGGSNNTRVDTGLVDTNFDGALVDVEAKKVIRSNKELIVSFLQYVGDSTGDIDVYDKNQWNIGNWTWSTTRPSPVTPPPRQPTPVTFKSGNSMLLVTDALDMRTGGSMSFRFRTLEPRGLLVMGHGSAVQFFAIEVFDGILYFVADFGSATSRNMFSDSRVDDGEWHEVTMRVDRNVRTVTLTLDGRQFVDTVSPEELQRMYFFKTFFGGYDNFESAPWPLYSREGFKGCFESLVINGVGIDLHRVINTQRLVGIEFGCSPMSRSCQSQPCAYGFCRDRMNGYVCDCANTPYTGQNCNANAVIAGWDGSNWSAFNFVNREVTHTNDLSVRFYTPLRDTLLFRTEADNKDDYIQAELVDGRAKVTIKVDGIVKQFFTGKNLNDYFWHTLYIRRRADDVQVWVDDEDKMTGVMGGENYKLYIDRIMFGSLGNKGELRGANNYIGYMQNFIYDDKEIFNLMRSQSTNSNMQWFIEPVDKLPLLTYKPITVTSSETYFQLPSIPSTRTMKILFKFKTRESNGLILYNSGSGSDAIAVEMSNGQLRLAYNIGGRNQFTVVPTGQLNDNMWHTVQVALNERGQFTVRVDGENVQVSTSGSLSLAGTLYIGGLPQAMFSRPEVASLIESRKGFRGCLASVDLNGAVPDLMNYATDKSKIIDGCRDLNVACAPNACAMGMCVPRANDYYCDCNMTGYVGVPCTDFPTGYYFGKNGGSGIVLYEFPLERQLNSNEDMLAFGFMTLERDGVLYRIESGLDSNEYIEIRLENGHIIAESNTGTGLVRLVEDSRLFNDGQYHVVRYIRTGSNSTLQVNQLPTKIAVNTGVLSLFKRVHRVMLGGRTDSSGAIIRNYYGIIGGAYYNGHRWLDLLLSKTQLHGKLVQIKGDVVLVKPFLLTGGGKTTPAPPDLVIPPGVTIPTDIGGGGVIGPGIGGSGGIVPEIPSIGGAGGVLPPITGIDLVGPSIQVPGAVAAAQVGPAGMMGGARAGAVVGTVLGTMAFLTSLMWALYKLKPGVPTCLSPGAGAGGGGAGMTISSPRAASNLGAVQAASAGAGGGSGLSAAGANGALSKVTVVNGSASGVGAGGAGAGGGSSTYTSYFQSTSTTVGGGSAGGGGAGVSAVGGGADAVDASTLRATGTFSNKGTAIGSPTAARRNMSSSAYSSNYQSNTMQSFGSGGGTMDRGYTGQYLSQSSGDGIPDYDMPVAGTLTSGNSYSSSTLNTHYNYQVANSAYSTRLITVVPPKPDTYTSVLNIIMTSGKNQSISPRSDIYCAALAPSRDQGFVDRSEDIIVEHSPQLLMVRSKINQSLLNDSRANGNTTVEGDVTSKVQIHTGPAPFAMYSNKSYFEMPKDKETLQITTKNANTTRRTSLQVPSNIKTTVSRNGYERLESCSSEININSMTSSEMTSSKSRKRDERSRDDLYESTATITSDIQLGSVDSGLDDRPFAHQSEKHILDLSLEDFKSNFADNIYAKVDKTLKTEKSHTVSSKTDFEMTNMTSESSSRTEFGGYTVTCTAQLKGDRTADTVSELQETRIAFNDTLKNLEQFADIDIDFEDSHGAVGTDAYLGGNQIERSENVISFTTPSLIKKTGNTAIKESGTSHFQTQHIELSETAYSCVNETRDQKAFQVAIIDTTDNGRNLDAELNTSVHELLAGMNVPEDRWAAAHALTGDAGEADTYQVQNLKTVTINKQGQYVMSSGMASGGAVTPGAAADEVRVDCCLMTSDGRNVVTGSSLGPPQVWDMQNGELQNIMKGDTIGSTHLHLVCGDRLLVGAVHADMEINEYSCRKGVVNHTLQIWDFMTGRPLSMAEGEYCSAICPMSDSDKVLFGRTDKFGDATSIIAWDLMGNQMIKEMRYDAPVGNNDYISYLNKSKNDRYIVAGFTNSFDNNAEFMTFDMTLTSYNISEPAMLKLDANPEVTAILPKDEAVTGLRNGDLVIWGIRNAQPSRQLLGSGGAHAHTREVKCVALSEDGRYLVSGSADGTLKVWDMNTERPVQTLQGHTDEVWCTAISSDNEIVVSGSADGTIRLWRVKNGTEMCVFNCGVDIFYVTMSRDKGTIVALGDKFLARKLIMLQVVRTKIKKIVSS